MAPLRLDAMDPPREADEDDAAPGSKQPGAQAAPNAAAAAAVGLSAALLGRQDALLRLPRGGLPGSSGGW